MENNLQNNQGQNWANMMPDYYVYDVRQMRVGFGKRVGAAFIDLFIFLVVYIFAIMVSGVFSEIDFSSIMADPQGFAEDMETLAPITSLIGAIVGILYYSLEIFIGQSVGKMLLSIQIADKDRKKATFSQLLIRYLVKFGNYFVSIAFGITAISIFETIDNIYGFVILIGLFFVLGANRQAFHDMLAKTAVFNKDEIINDEKLN